MRLSEIQYECVVSLPFEENTYLVFDPQRDDLVIVDPGLEPGKIQTAVTRLSRRPVAILNTHGHSDHIAGNAFCKQQWPEAPLIIGRGDAPKLTDPVANLSAPFGVSLVSPPADQLVDEGDLIEAAGIVFQVRETPGHSCGHVVFVMEQSRPWTVLAGDVLFRGSVGRTDFPDSDPSALIRSIHEKLFTLPPETIVLPGHGPATTVGQEQASNPFV